MTLAAFLKQFKDNPELYRDNLIRRGWDPIHLHDLPDFSSYTEETQRKYWGSYPNFLDPDVPEGKNADSNIIAKQLKIVPLKREFTFDPLPHHLLQIRRGKIDTEQAVRMAGSRFVALMGEAARLERLLAAFMLEHAVEEGYTEVSPPYLVNENALFGAGQWPRFEKELYQDEDLYLISTGEVPLVNLVANSVTPQKDLPLRYVACTPCFRLERVGAGQAVKGLNRVHQFHKVELVSITDEEHSAAEHERMVRIATAILDKLGLHYRVMLLCGGETGFAAAKTYDIEVWAPGQERFLEVASISNCRQFQALRLEARYKETATGKNKYVHTLNGSALAVGRTMAALLENRQQAGGYVNMDEVLDFCSDYRLPAAVKRRELERFTIYKGPYD